MTRPLIRIRSLTKHYRMGDTVVAALDGVDLDIAEGEYVAITGPSGSGKSTMMHLVGCLDRPTGGTYELDGDMVSAMRDRQLAGIRNRKIGFVFQTFNLIQRTSAVDNVAVPLFYARQTQVRDPSLKALERVGLGARAFHRPNELSGGERQRVAIARAIVTNPRLLLADEPTGNLDSKNGRQIMDIFRELNRAGVTIVLVTHEMSVAAEADRIIRMRDGHVVEDRPVNEELRRELVHGIGAAPTSDAAESPAASKPGSNGQGGTGPAGRGKDDGDARHAAVPAARPVPVARPIAPADADEELAAPRKR